MKTRFRKVWCASCSTMQFAGECPHGRGLEVRPPVEQRALALHVEKVVPRVHEPSDQEVILVMHRNILPVRAPWLPLRRRCSCRPCSVSMPCLNLAGA